MAAIGVYWRTLRYLKVRQILGRGGMQIGACVPAGRDAPSRRASSGEWVVPARRRQSLVGASRFRFLGREASLGTGGWDPPQEERLWRYNLHYFDDLNAEGAQHRSEWHTALLSRWIAENVPARGTGWEPYPTSLRVVNWVKWMQTMEDPAPEWLESLALQVRWLTRRIEWHLLGNHLFANAKALFVAGMFFCGPEPDRWRRRAIRILEPELHEQVLDDGGQIERTPMYHRLALEDVLDMLLFIKRYGEPDHSTVQLKVRLQDCAERMWSWAEAMQFRDGSMPRFNDTAEGIAPSHLELTRVAKELNLRAPGKPRVPVHVLSDTGYVRLNWDEATAFLDVAPIGPDYNPGHAHADTLSFELEIGDRQVVVNRGTSCYGQGARREYERSTAAHSTVELAGLSSSETWSGFRVGRRARPRDLSISSSQVTCAHDGYRYLRGRPLHRRTWTMRKRSLLVEDEVGAEHPAIARFHLAPGLRAETEGTDALLILSGAEEVVRVRFEAGWLRTVTCRQAIAFGELLTADTIELGLERGRASTYWTW